MRGEEPRRPRAWVDATFANKRSTGPKTRITRDSPDGDEIQDANKGGKGERWALLHSFTDYYDEEGAHRARFLPDTLQWTRGASVDHASFLPWFTKVVDAARELRGGAEFEAHLDNSRAHLFPEGFNPRGPRRKRQALVARALEVCDELEAAAGREGGGEKAGLRDFGQEGAKELARFLTDGRGARAPEIFKIAEGRGRVVERTPPYRPEIQPVEYARRWLESSYDARRDNNGEVPGFLEAFLERFRSRTWSRRPTTAARQPGGWRRRRKPSWSTTA